MKNLLNLIDSEKPHFADDILKTFSDDIRKEAEEFSRSIYWCDSESINIQNIQGTMHPDYAGNTWLNLLKNGKRMAINLRLLEENPSYYEEPKKKEPTMYFIAVDDKYYIGGDGNHRTCIARFLKYYKGESVLHGVNLTRYLIDHDFKATFKDLEALFLAEKLALKLEVKRDLVKRDDTAGWKCDYYDLKAVIKSYDGEIWQECDTKEMKRIIKEADKPFKKLFGEFKNIWRKK